MYTLTRSLKLLLIGFYETDVARKYGRRQSTYVTYVEPILETRKNLKLIKFAEATRIMFDKAKRASGVYYDRHGTEFKAFAKKEVIVSAGALGSPLLLFKSGIGPSQMIKEAKVRLSEKKFQWNNSSFMFILNLYRFLQWLIYQLARIFRTIKEYFWVHFL